ncbi:hypothetical protein TCAL_07699 [Tigriopus californicus]|uniref:Actin n=1 Tax=Tigriopus californicus TaxID=6832 RepID=A0A553NET1_TIGCA|nr:actin-3-like [Tigriopus californicus]TRY63952.1 hypothetical protein TCAL_07699 [Tigriopus californicus]|eukprot:TCALIF_07699-PA protein Name:"Similar to Actin, cytoplasmic (Biomphalaria obstructa)" AED:0.01 eAED:0.01 QI:0/-1/0/1/-1/1/1/0/376
MGGNESDSAHLVVDLGSNSCKAGFAGDRTPPIDFPSIVGNVIHPKGILTYVGDKAQTQRGIVSQRCPIKHGLVTNWHDMERIWHHVLYNHLNVDPEEHAILLTQELTAPKRDRETMTELMFEIFNIQALYVADPSRLSMYASKKSTGIVVNSGFDTTHITPVYENHVLAHACNLLKFGGQDITLHLLNLLTQRRSSFLKELDGIAKRNIAQRIKETLAYVALDFGKEMAATPYSSLLSKTCDLSSGEVITIHKERFRCAEALFQPSDMGLNQKGIHQMTLDSIMRCDEDIRKELFSNIILTGGSTMLPGMAARMEREITALAPPYTKINVISPSDRQYSPWIGGSILASQPQFQQMCISQEEYDEIGPSIVHRRCF